LFVIAETIVVRTACRRADSCNCTCGTTHSRLGSPRCCQLAPKLCL
jgi:hypothetical protein